MTPVPDPSRPFANQEPLVLLAMLVFGEARSEVFDAKLAVANVVMNRVRTGFGKNVSVVALKPYQFSCFLPSDNNRVKLLDPLKYESQTVWDNCFYAAGMAYSGEGGDPSNGAVFYHDSTIAEPPKAWGPVVETAQIGRLTFYKPVVQELKAA